MHHISRYVTIVIFVWRLNYSKPAIVHLIIKMNKQSKIFSLLFVLMTISTYGQVNTCGNRQSNHPLDKRIFEIRDSLHKENIDTVLVYSHWLQTGSFNGYGKVIWKDHGHSYQIKIPFHNGDGAYGLGQQELKTMENDSAISFFFLNRIDTITVLPVLKTSEIRHDAVHFVAISFTEQEYCYVVKGFLIQDNPDHALSKWIMLLADENVAPVKYLDGTRIQAKYNRKKKKVN